MVSGEWDWSGIVIEDSSYISVYDNNVVAIGGNGVEITWSSSDVSVYGNNIEDNEVGVNVESSNNKIFHNNFINNDFQAEVSVAVTNVWDDGYPSGGNYWSDYTGVDLYSGPNQNQLGSDGIGDTPYPLAANNIDHYPFKDPYGWSPPPVGGIHIPVDKFGLLAPYIGLASTILVATVATTIYIKRIKYRKEKR